MKTLYHGNRNRTIEMLQEELFYSESYILVYGEYRTAHDPVDCECLVCGYTWLGKPNNLLNGQGCNSCAGRVNPSLVEFQKQLDRLGKNFKVSGDFVKSTQKLTATCNNCGFSWEAISLSLRRQSTQCRSCAVYPTGGFDQSKPGTLYYLRITSGDQKYWKIGITNQNLMKRYRKKEDREIITPLFAFTFESGTAARKAEQGILKMYSEYLVPDLKILKGHGNTEIFFRDVLQLDHLEDNNLWL